MRRSIFLSILPVLGAQAASLKARTSVYTPPKANCVDYEIPITYSTLGIKFIPTWSDNYALTDFVTLAATRASANFSAPLTAGASLTGKHTISATFCSPKSKNEHSKTVLLASHGLGFDRNYWNSQIEPDNYNFVQYVIDKGYSIFFYDRLGTGKSSVGGHVNGTK
jgi:hypothetical protein